MIELRSIYDWDKKLLDSILAIDAKVYKEDDQGTFDEEYDKYTANRDTYLFIHDGEILVGYLSFFPIKDELYQEIRKGERNFDTAEISGETLEKWQSGRSYKLFMLSVVITPEYQGRGLSHLLADGFMEFMKKKKEENITIASALAITVSDGGRRFVKKVGFETIAELGDGKILHEIEFEEATSNA